MKRLPAIWFATAKKIVSSFSLLLAVQLALAAEYADIKAKLDAAPSLAVRKKILREFASKGTADNELQLELDRLIEAWDSGSSWSPEPAIEMIELRAISERSSLQVDAIDVKKAVVEIKRDPLYSDPGIEESSNWFSRAMQRLGDLISKYLEGMFGRQGSLPNAPRVDPPAVSAIAALVQIAVYTILALLIGLFVFFVAKHFHWKAKLRRRATALLEEDEPERTLDEWLQQADKLIAEGKYREAVRCLYLACLLRFDEANIARFVRSQTNWEHLSRIESSAKLPAGLAFREPTQAFDRIWYGFRVNGMDDVSRFRAWYLEITQKTTGGQA